MATYRRQSLYVQCVDDPPHKTHASSWPGNYYYIDIFDDSSRYSEERPARPGQQQEQQQQQQQKTAELCVRWRFIRTCVLDVMLGKNFST